MLAVGTVQRRVPLSAVQDAVVWRWLAVEAAVSSEARLEVVWQPLPFSRCIVMVKVVILRTRRGLTGLGPGLQPYTCTWKAAIVLYVPWCSGPD